MWHCIQKGFKWIEHNNHPLYWVNKHKTWLTRQNPPWSCHFLLFFYIVLVTIMKPPHMNVQKLTNHSRGLNDICVWVGPAPPTLSSLYSLHARTYVGTPPCGNQCDNTRSIVQIFKLTSLSLTCERSPSINLKIMNVMSTWIFVIWTRYCHIGP